VALPDAIAQNYDASLGAASLVTVDRQFVEAHCRPPVLASGSVQHLRRLQPGAAIDRRRFRPNLYVETGPSGPAPSRTHGWGGTLAVGATLRIDGMQPALGCVTTTLAQGDLPRDVGVLRTSAKHHRGCVGVFGAVRVPGLARTGDPVFLRK
jgi:uncharacterized protein YcbX